ncbi:zinc finger protein 768-like isoform X4 [Eriocheir sinensis]|uniref:zinc finger protein 768-like isoform X4 n=1 Tax=Eriocheir sinensis TaxID=95602 RepID=UPI0021C60495|nr:zinc finger protein 768-like isoform X4 [Eriocheir sinensis]
MGDGMLSLSWNNHSTTFCHMLSALRLKERYTDATVACEGKFYPVHKLVLSTCSQYFEEMFDHTAGKHPVVLLQDVRRDELEALLSYMYAGIVSVAQRDLSRLIKVAELLQIKGLAVPDEIPSEKRSKGSSSHSSSSEKVSSRSHPSEASDDRSSPHPKRRRREGSSEEPQVRPDSPGTYNSVSQECYKNEYHSHDAGGDDAAHRLEDGSSDICDGDRPEVLKRVHPDKAAQHKIDHQSAERYQAHSQDSSRSQYKDVNEETIEIKEETLEEAGEQPSTNNLSGSMEYCGGMPGDASSEGPQEDHSRLVMPAKYDDQGHQGPLPPQALPEVVVEALAGPSGMHEWLGGSEFSGGLAGSDNYSGESSPPPHPVAGKDSVGEGAGGRPRLASGPKLHHCSFCSYSTPRKDHMTMHIRTHTGEKPFGCPYCSSRFVQKGTLNNHIRTHTGEKPYSCPACPQNFARNSHLKSHLATHKETLAL